MNPKKFELDCRVCASRFEYEKTGTGRLPRFCSESCKSKAFARSAKTEHCAVCGARFAVRYLTAIERAKGRGRFCSIDCWVSAQRVYSSRADRNRAKYHRRAASKRKAPAERFPRKEIYERDHWQCGLCGKRVDKRLKPPHLMSASLDHIVPLAKGGAHTRQNVQCAHWLCNTRKSAGPGGQLRMFG